MLLVLVHEPRHDLRVGSHVGCRNVRIGPDEIVNLIDKFSCQAFEFRLAEAAWIDGNASLGSTIGKINNSGLPGHELGQCLNFGIINLGVITHSSLHRTACTIVLHSVSEKRFEIAIVKSDGDLNFDVAFRRE